jgi:nonsense-mediated mRNA decay protein 3
MKFCFVCGKKSESLIKGYCEECYKSKFKLIEVPEEIEVAMCNRCKKINEKNKWKEAEIDEILKDKIKILGKNVKIRFEKNDNVKVHAKGFLEGSKEVKEEVHEVKIRIRKRLCSVCFKKSGKYYESIVQIRGSLTDDDMDSIDDIVLERGGFYRLEDTKGGYDFYVSDKSLARKIAEFFRKKYKVDIKKSFKLFTRKEGKDIYRDTILLRI